MKLRMCVFFLLAGCDPTNPFVRFTPSNFVPEDSGATVDTGTADSGTDNDGGGIPEADGASGSDSMVPGSGGAGGISTVLDGATGGKPPSRGGAPASGGAPGADADACVLTTHTNGLSSTWQDCAELGTYSKSQAMRACEASGAPECRATNCGVGNLVVCGYKDSYVYGCWGYEGDFAGYAKERNDSCSTFPFSWG